MGKTKNKGNIGIIDMKNVFSSDNLDLNKQLENGETIRKFCLVAGSFLILIYSLICLLPFIFCLYIFIKYCSDSKPVYLIMLIFLFIILLLLIFSGAKYIMNGVALKFKYYVGRKYKNDLLASYGIKELTSKNIKEVRESGLYDFDKMITDDKYFGEYKGVPFEIYDTSLIKEDESVNRYGNKEKSKYQIFKGLILILPFFKELKSRIFIKSKKDTCSRSIKNYVTLFLFYVVIIYSLQFFFNIIFYIFKINDITNIYFSIPGIIVAIICFCIVIKCKKYNFREVNIESIDFEKHFDIFAEDQIEARYILNPTLIERFTNLKTAFGSNGLKCVFFDNKLVITIESDRDLFEIVDLYTPIKGKKQLQRFNNEILSIHAIIDSLKLDQKTKL